MARVVREVLVRKWITVLLLIVATAVIAGLTLSLTGKVYSKLDPIPFRELRLLYSKWTEGPLSFSVFMALIMPMLLNIFMFVPWGFLMFLVLDRPARPTHQSYLLTALLAIAFSGAVEISQYFLPTRVTDVNDVIWNGAGAIVGAVLGHLRKRVRVSFE